MITEDRYKDILVECEKFCRHHKIEDYMDFAHDIICSGETDNVEKSVRKLWGETKKLPEIVYLEEYITGKERIIQGIRNHDEEFIEVSLYCYGCDLSLPEQEFPISNLWYRRRQCKCCYKPMSYRTKPITEDTRRLSKTSKQKERGLLKDGYIIDVLKKNGFKKEEITSYMILEKKRSILEKRSRKIA